ncbi:MAG TPA: halocarboxylic acid dehydrogenase DehI family protein [Patescibacteria group bacterium]|nr:halocarboxylic acid dehydrogenase DehI family protein [Patescibacteria group bacterium]
MIHLKPIVEREASVRLQHIFADISQTFRTPVAPLIFRYLANYEDYLEYVWQRIKTNIQSQYFQDATQVLTDFAMQKMMEIYQPSHDMTRFIGYLSQEEKHMLQKTVVDLDKVNGQLCVLTIGIREGVKGVFIGQEVSQYAISRTQVEEIFETFSLPALAEDPSLAAANSLLAPVFGSSSLLIVQYPQFFALCSEEMKILLRSEAYLQRRVLLEHEGLKAVDNLQYPLGTSYAELAYFAANKPYFNELLYILSETFPTQFPRLVMTTQLMKIALGGIGNVLRNA